MRRSALLVSSFALLVLALPTSAGDTQKPRLRVLPALDDLLFDRPTHLTNAGDGSGRLFVCEQKGILWACELAKPPERPKATRTVFLDIAARTRCEHNEEGLLSVAFHPRFKTNGRVFVAYSTGKRYRPSTYQGDRTDCVKTRVSRFELKPGEQTLRPESEKVILEGYKPWGNHNGGQLAFGPDGFLYFALGDGGAGGDPENNGQDLSRLLAKMLRIDVDHGDPYAIPKDNPFVSVAGARPEIWAYGLRNAWRFSFDRKTKKLWAGDVGQDKWESIKVVEKGSNQGWSVFEGNHAFKRGSPRDPVVKAVWEYGRDDGASVTGGFVYRGERLTELQGIYVFGDYVTGHIFGLRETKDGPEVWRLIDRSQKAPSSFGEGEDGELYLVHHQRESGAIFRFEVVKPD